MSNTAATLLDGNFDLGRLRPWIHEDGRHRVTVRRNSADPKSLLVTLPAEPRRPALLPKGTWMEVDRVVLREFREASPIAGSLISEGLFIDLGGRGMQKMVLESADVDGRTLIRDQHIKEFAAARERLDFHLDTLRLPITHADFVVKADSRTVVHDASVAARSVGEEVDAAVLRALGEMKWGEADTFIQASCMLELVGFPGPHRRIGNFVVQMTPDVIRLVNGLDLVTVQWQRERCKRDSDGDGNCGSKNCPDCGGDGSKLGWVFKVLCIAVPQVRPDRRGGVGICRLCPAPHAKTNMDGMG